MAYRKKTLRSMLPVTRKVARLIGELGSIEQRLKNLIPELQRIVTRPLLRDQPQSRPDSKPANKIGGRDKMGYILIGRHKHKPDIWHDMNGIYEYPDKSDFGSLSQLKRNTPCHDLRIIDKAKFNREYSNKEE